MRCDDNIITSK